MPNLCSRDGHPGELSLGLLQEIGEQGIFVKSDDDDFGETFNLGESEEGMVDHRL